jgi:hypothetical protein
MLCAFECCVSLATRAWLITHLSTPSFCLSFVHFLTTFRIHLDIPHLKVLHLSWCQCNHTIDDLGIHLFRCPCKNECTTTHNVFWNIVATIALKSGVHAQIEVSHLFPHHTCRQVDIVITRNNFQTLVDVVIIDSIRPNLV